MLEEGKLEEEDMNIVVMIMNLLKTDQGISKCLSSTVNGSKGKEEECAATSNYKSFDHEYYDDDGHDDQIILLEHSFEQEMHEKLMLVKVDKVVGSESLNLEPSRTTRN